MDRFKCLFFWPKILLWVEPCLSIVVCAKCNVPVEPWTCLPAFSETVIKRPTDPVVLCISWSHHSHQTRIWSEEELDGWSMFSNQMRMGWSEMQQHKWQHHADNFAVSIYIFSIEKRTKLWVCVKLTLTVYSCIWHVGLKTLQRSPQQRLARCNI